MKKFEQFLVHKFNMIIPCNIFINFEEYIIVFLFNNLNKLFFVNCCNTKLNTNKKWDECMLNLHVSDNISNIVEYLYFDIFRSIINASFRMTKTYNL